MKVGITLGVIVFFYLSLAGITRWSGRSMTLLDPTYAKRYIPIIASVSEHQPTTWGTYFTDLQYLLVFTPVGYYFAYRQATYGTLFVALYGILSIYFSCVMIRLLLVVAPAVCVLAAIGVSNIFSKMAESLKDQGTEILEWALDSNEADEPEEKTEEPEMVEEAKEEVSKSQTGGKGKKGKKKGPQTKSP